MAELADAADSKSADRKVMGVRPPLPAPVIVSLSLLFTYTYMPFVTLRQVAGTLFQVQKWVQCASYSFE